MWSNPTDSPKFSSNHDLKCLICFSTSQFARSIPPALALNPFGVFDHSFFDRIVCCCQESHCGAIVESSAAFCLEKCMHLHVSIGKNVSCDGIVAMGLTRCVSAGTKLAAPSLLRQDVSTRPLLCRVDVTVLSSVSHLSRQSLSVSVCTRPSRDLFCCSRSTFSDRFSLSLWDAENTSPLPEQLLRKFRRLKLATHDVRSPLELRAHRPCCGRHRCHHRELFLPAPRSSGPPRASLDSYSPGR